MTSILSIKIHKKKHVLKDIQLFAPRKFFMLFCHLLIFFHYQLFEKIISGILSECQTDWIQIRPDISSGLIWVQSVCKGYEQMTLVGNELSYAFISYDFQTLNYNCLALSHFDCTL